MLPPLGLYGNWKNKSIDIVDYKEKKQKQKQKIGTFGIEKYINLQH